MYFTPAIKIGRAPSPDTVPGRPLAIVARFTHSSGVICRHAAPTDKQCSSILCSRGLPRSPSPAAVPSPYANANKPAARLAPRRIDRRCHTTRRCVARPVAPPQGAQRLANSKKIRSAHPRPAARRAPRRHGQAGTARTRDASADPLSRPRRGVLARWRHYVTTDGGCTGLRRFHARQRLLLLAHDPEAYRDLSRLVDEATSSGLLATAAAYGRQLEQALAVPQELLGGMLRRVAPRSWAVRQSYLEPELRLGSPAVRAAG